MRLRAALVATTVTSLLLVPLATSASAVPTTSTIVAYGADTDNNGVRELYTRPADGTGSPTKLFTNTASIWLPSLSPDGTKVAYLMGDAKDSEGEPIFRLHVRPSTAGGSTTMLLHKNVNSSVSWSADGTQIVASTYDWITDTWGTYVVNADGSGTPQLVPTTSTIYGEEPSLSPSGDVVAIDAFDANFEYVGIDLISLATGKRARISGTTGGSDPSWSPDGRHIVFQRFLSTCGVGLYRVPASGGTPVTLREVPNRFLGSAEYSRDGSQLFFNEAPMSACGTSTPKGEIWLSNADGTGATNISNSAIYESGTTVAGGTPMAADVTAPDAPSVNPVATVTATSATISWNPPADDAVEYVVMRRDTGAPAPTSITDGTVEYRGPARSATVTGLTSGSVYDLYVFAIDASGNVSAASAPHDVKATPVPAMSPIGRVGTTTAGLAFPVKWNGTTAAFDVRVGQRVRSASGTWGAPVFTTIRNATADKQLTYTGGQGRTYHFGVRGHDGLGNVTAWSASALADVPLDSAYSGMKYSSGWSARTGSTRYLGTFHTTVTPNASVTLTADTSRFVVIGDKCATCGAIKVYIDGAYRFTVDTKASTTQVRQVLYASSPFTGIKRHTIKLVAVGTSGRPRVSIDGIALTR